MQILNCRRPYSRSKSMCLKHNHKHQKIRLLIYKSRLLAVEKEASNLGLQLLEDFDLLEEDEIKIVKAILRAAFMTYVGDFFRAMLSWTGLTRKSAKP